MKKEIYLKKLRKVLDNTDNYFDNELNEIISIADKVLVDERLIDIKKVKVMIYRIHNKIKILLNYLKSTYSKSVKLIKLNR